jgi:hypothetical protein
VYGTQIADVSDDGAVPWPIEDPEHLDDRRATVGLEPFAKYAKNWSAPRPESDV